MSSLLSSYILLFDLINLTSVHRIPLEHEDTQTKHQRIGWDENMMKDSKRPILVSTAAVQTK